MSIDKGIGGMDGIRTRDHCIKSAMLYRLSYHPDTGVAYNLHPLGCFASHFMQFASLSTHFSAKFLPARQKAAGGSQNPRPQNRQRTREPGAAQDYQATFAGGSQASRIRSVLYSLPPCQPLKRGDQ